MIWEIIILSFESRHKAEVQHTKSEEINVIQSLILF